MVEDLKRDIAELPKDIKSIIDDYVDQLSYFDRMNKCVRVLKKFGPRLGCQVERSGGVLSIRPPICTNCFDRNENGWFIYFINIKGELNHYWLTKYRHFGYNQNKPSPYSTEWVPQIHLHRHTSLLFDADFPDQIDFFTAMNTSDWTWNPITEVYNSPQFNNLNEY